MGIQGDMLISYYVRESTLSLVLKNDAWYQQLLHDCCEAEAHYLRICACLSEADQELLERYISLCEELEHRRTYLESTS